MHGEHFEVIPLPIRRFTPGIIGRILSTHLEGGTALGVGSVGDILYVAVPNPDKIFVFDMSNLNDIIAPGDPLPPPTYITQLPIARPI